MNELEKLYAEQKAISKKIAKLTDAEAKRLQKEYKVLVGTCYRFPNSFGGGDKFWSYLQVLKIESVWISFGKANINALAIQIDDHPDAYRIEREVTNLNMWTDNPINYQDFLAVYTKVLKFITPV